MAFPLSVSTGFDFSSSLSNSEKIQAAKYFSAEDAAEPTLWEKADTLSVDVVEAYTSDLDLGSVIGLDSSQFLGGLAGADPGWTFITAPEDISWSVNNSVSRVDIFGTNSPPVVVGTRGMRDLDLNNALVEGFVRGVTIEGKVAALENLMNYGLNSSDGFVTVPVYQVWANNKSYGGAEAYYVIENVKVKETMRDLTGNATRAYVDISLKQVPAYQVNSGRDLATKSAATAQAALLSETQARNLQRAAAASGTNSASAAANAAGNQGVGTEKPKDGPGTPNNRPPAGNQGGRGAGDSPDQFGRLRQEGF